MIPTPIHGGKDPDEMNSQRTGWGLDLVATIQRLTGADQEDAVCDAIAYLLHAAQHLQQNPAHELIRAIHHFNAETGAPSPYSDDPAMRAIAEYIGDHELGPDH